MPASISAFLVRPLVSTLPGPDSVAAFYTATDLTPEILADREARVSPAQFCVAWAEAVRLTGDPLLALHIADATPPGAFGIIEYLCGAAPTLGEALRQWSRFLSIVDDAVEVGLVDAGASRALRLLRESQAPAPRSHELCFAQVIRHGRAMLGPGLRLVEVAFEHATHADVGHYRAWFGCPVRFGAKHTEIVFGPGVLDLPSATADSNLIEILLPLAEAQRVHRPAHLPVTAHVRRALQGALSSDDAQLEAVARRLGMSGRGLQRRLKDEGAVFQTIRDETRLELADAYLRQEISFAEISFLLGFSEPSAFLRAFKRWTGVTPLERRSSLIAARA